MQIQILILQIAKKGIRDKYCTKKFIMTISQKNGVSICKKKDDLEGQFSKWKSGMPICIINKMERAFRSGTKVCKKNTPERQQAKCDLEWECAK